MRSQRAIVQHGGAPLFSSLSRYAVLLKQTRTESVEEIEIDMLDVLTAIAESEGDWTEVHRAHASSPFSCPFQAVESSCQTTEHALRIFPSGV